MVTDGTKNCALFPVLKRWCYQENTGRFQKRFIGFWVLRKYRYIFARSSFSKTGPENENSCRSSRLMAIHIAIFVSHHSQGFDNYWIEKIFFLWFYWECQNIVLSIYSMLSRHGGFERLNFRLQVKYFCCRLEHNFKKIKSVEPLFGKNGSRMYSAPVIWHQRAKSGREWWTRKQNFAMLKHTFATF